MAGDASILLAVAGGGAAGSLMRYGTVRLGATLGLEPPIATICVNVVGSLLMGLLVGLVLAKGGANDILRAGLAVGFLGSFTTFSTFSLESISLIRDRGMAIGAAYMTSTVILCIAATLIGMLLSGAFSTGSKP